MDQLSIEQKKAVVIEEIIAAFDGVQREDGMSLHEAEAIDNYAGPEERATARAIDTETRWQDIPAEAIAECQTALHYFDPKGFRYNIPAFLIWYLTCEEGSNTSDTIFYFLDSDYATTSDGLYLPHVSLLTPEQSTAIAHFLVFVAEQTKSWNLEFWEHIDKELEEELKTELASGHLSKEEYEAEREEFQQRKDKYASQISNAQSALDRYWCQFL